MLCTSQLFTLIPFLFQCLAIQFICLISTQIFSSFSLFRQFIQTSSFDNLFLLLYTFPFRQLFMLTNVFLLNPSICSDFYIDGMWQICISCVITFGKKILLKQQLAVAVADSLQLPHAISSEIAVFTSSGGGSGGFHLPNYRHQLWGTTSLSTPKNQIQSLPEK